MREFEPVKAGEWIKPIMRGYRMRCCDCGLIHRLDFKVKGKRIYLRAFREVPGAETGIESYETDRCDT